ncbi:CDP-glycerol glycerophosphotransferase family protein [Glutamicibacter creatinolyticus]|uniref:CDP-glycerol glycerophosphotransferase family protein n=1 Tax=Glutamicibacter creatinolyticus TaxID=162496 RepID=UPI003216EF44
MKQSTRRESRSMQMRKASTIWEKKKSNNRAGIVYYGNNGELLKPKRTLLINEITPLGPDKSTLRIKLRVYDDLRVSKLWAKNLDEWLEIGEFSEDSLQRSDGTRYYEALIDLRRVSEVLSTQSEYGLRKINQVTGDEVGTRYHLYFQALSSQRRPPAVGKNVEVTEDGFAFRYPLGKARRTRVGTFTRVTTAHGSVTPYINKSGFLSLAVDEEPSIFTKVFNDGIRYESNKLVLKGRIFTRHDKVDDARILIVGRTTGYIAEMDTELGFLKRATEREFGHRRYIINASYDLRNDFSSFKDDILDFYVDLDFAGSRETIRKRFGKTRYLLRRKQRAFQIVDGNKVVSFVPYFTFQAKNPSLQVEVFDDHAYSAFLSKNRKKIKKKTEKPVWLIGEMPYKAQDNGLAFFRYMQDSHPEIDTFYVLSKESPERKNLEGYKNVIDYRSREHIEITAKAEKIISTHAPLQLYPTKDAAICSNSTATKVFLQHGVTAGKWIAPVFGRGASDFEADQIMVCSQREKEFFVQDLGYEPGQVSITGFTRFDSLFNDDVVLNKSQVFIMPTWRQWLQDPTTFCESEYYRKWIGFLSSPEVLRLTKKNNLELVFCLHPNMQQYTHLFSDLDARIVFQGEVNVQYLIKQSAIMITDYSSAALDFSFLHKPVLYYQFDAERFEAPHADPLTELPGPVATSERDLIKNFMAMIRDGFSMREEFKNRADRFLKYRDQENCRRTFEAIESFEGPKKSLDDIIDPDFKSTVSRYIRRHRAYGRVSRAFYNFARTVFPMDAGTIVFESTLARSFGGNPKAIYEELVTRKDPRRKVIVSNRRERVRDDRTVVVKRHSWAFLWYLATAKYWINDQNFPHYVRRRNKGIYVQTWHGTPLKKMFLDQENFYGRDAGYVDRVTTMAAQWNRVVSPNRHTTQALRSSYAYEGPVYELGYPRNDILSHSERDLIGERVRQRLGIPADKYVVLYAPTFRDDKPTKRGRFAFDWPFTPHAFVDNVDEDVVLLVRTHNLVSTKLNIPHDIEDRILDVSHYPDIQELFLASNMLVTDYSSSFFDYAILNRPIIFFAFDLSNYRDNLRGFYLDYEKELPGPIVQRTSELYAEISRQRNVRSSFNINKEFVAKFAPHEDGNAASRVVDTLL